MHATAASARARVWQLLVRRRIIIRLRHLNPASVIVVRMPAAAVAVQHATQVGAACCFGACFGAAALRTRGQGASAGLPLTAPGGTRMQARQQQLQGL